MDKNIIKTLSTFNFDNEYIDIRHGIYVATLPKGDGDDLPKPLSDGQTKFIANPNNNFVEIIYPDNSTVAVPIRSFIDLVNRGYSSAYNIESKFMIQRKEVILSNMFHKDTIFDKLKFSTSNSSADNFILNYLSEKDFSRITFIEETPCVISNHRVTIKYKDYMIYNVNLEIYCDPIMSHYELHFDEFTNVVEMDSLVPNLSFNKLKMTAKEYHDNIRYELRNELTKKTYFNLSDLMSQISFHNQYYRVRQHSIQYRILKGMVD